MSVSQGEIDPAIVEDFPVADFKVLKAAHQVGKNRGLNLKIQVELTISDQDKFELRRFSFEFELSPATLGPITLESMLPRAAFVVQLFASSGLHMARSAWHSLSFHNLEIELSLWMTPSGTQVQLKG